MLNKIVNLLQWIRLRRNPINDRTRHMPVQSCTLVGELLSCLFGAKKLCKSYHVREKRERWSWFARWYMLYLLSEWQDAYMFRCGSWKKVGKEQMDNTCSSSFLHFFLPSHRICDIQPWMNEWMLQRHTKIILACFLFLVSVKDLSIDRSMDLCGKSWVIDTM